MRGQKPIMVANGRGGRVELYENHVRLIRDGPLSIIAAIGFLPNASLDKTIPLDLITSVEIVNPITAVGYIRFSYPGAPTPAGKTLKDQRAENVVLMAGFLPNTTFWKIKEYIENRQAQRARPPAYGEGLSEEIERLAGLRSNGVLSESEFVAAKKKLLGS